jgi:multiple antibiotic resistance protein
MHEWFNSFVVLFVVVDPIGLAPMFVALAPGADALHRRRVALRSALLAALILLAFFFVGDTLLRWLGIGLPAFRIAGGALLFLLAIDMVFARQSGLRSTTNSEQLEAERRRDISVFPLAFPLIAGPGALTTVLFMSSGAHGAGATASQVAVLLGVLGLTLVSLWFAHWIVTRIGETGANVLSRLFGLILAALAVQYVLDGLRAVWP